MDSATPKPTAAAPAPLPAEVLTAWPRSAQLATVFLLGMVTALLSVHILGSLRWTARPSDLEGGAVAGYRIDLNRASRAELLQVPGIGPTLADQIEEQRRQRGAFRHVDELLQVRGIGPATLQRIRPWLYVSQKGDEAVTRPARPTLPPDSVASSHALDGDERMTTGKKEAQLAGPIDINRASATELQRLPGIGPKLSERIIDERGKRPFKSVDDLRRVYGIGPKTVERLRPHVTVGSDPPAVAAAE